MSENSSDLSRKEERAIFFHNFFRVIIYTVFAAGVFFLLGVTVFALRTRELDRVVMPDVTGKYYVDVHNDLSRSRIRINISKLRFSDRPPGMILYQSVPPGSPVHPGDSLEIIVNQPEPLVRMPNLTGSSIQSAEAVLRRINYDDEVYALDTGAITRIPIDGIPPGTILSQFPSPGDMIPTYEKVYLLVSARVKGDVSLDEAEESLLRQNISILREYYRRQGQDYRIREILQPPESWMNGQVAEIRTDRSGLRNISVYFSRPEARYRNGYELVDITLSGGKKCEVTESRTPMYGEMGESEAEKTLFQTENVAVDESIRLVYFRRGVSKISAKCDGKVVFEKTLRPEDLG